MEPLTLKDIAIIDALPLHSINKRILTVGAGKGRLEYYLRQMGYEVYATDYQKEWSEEHPGIHYSISNIFDLASYPIKNAPMVICSEVLEHLSDYQTALKNLISLTEIRLIITVPWKKSYNDKAPPPLGHCNFWIDHGWRIKYKNINEFKKLVHPYSVSISKIITKEKDREKKGKCAYLIVVDKRQKLIYL